MPCNTGHVIESFLEPSKSHSHLIDEVLVVHISLIGHAPSSVDEMQLPSADDCPHLISLLVSCLIPPSIKECCLHNGKFVFSMFVKLAHHSVNSVLYSCELSPHVSAVIVVVYCFEPSYIIVRVRNQMNCDTRSIRVKWLFMMFFHHFFIVES